MHSWDISLDRDIVAWRPSREQPPGSGLRCMYLLLLCIWCVTWATCSALLLIFHTATFGTFNLPVIMWQMGGETQKSANQKSFQLETTRQLGSRMWTAKENNVWLFCQRHSNIRKFAHSWPSMLITIHRPTYWVSIPGRGFGQMVRIISGAFTKSSIIQPSLRETDIINCIVLWHKSAEWAVNEEFYGENWG